MVMLLIFILPVQSGFSQLVKSFDSPELGIKLSYPSYWEDLIVDGDCAEESTCSIESQSNNENYPNKFSFIISAYFRGSEFLQLCNCSTLKEFVQYDYKRAQSFYSDVSFINDNQTSIGKYPAWQVEYYGIVKMSEISGLEGMEDTKSRILNVFTKVNDTFYDISFFPTREEGAFFKHLPEVKKIIDSIEFYPPLKIEKKMPSFLDANETVASPLLNTTFNNTNTSQLENAINAFDTFFKTSCEKYNICTETQVANLKILTHNSFTDSAGYLHVVGEVKNDSTSMLEFVKVIATFYDSNNRVVGTEYAYTNPSTIQADNLAPFELILTSASLPLGQINNYKLVVSNE